MSHLNWHFYFFFCEKGLNPSANSTTTCRDSFSPPSSRSHHRQDGQVQGSFDTAKLLTDFISLVRYMLTFFRDVAEAEAEAEVVAEAAAEVVPAEAAAATIATAKISPKLTRSSSTTTMSLLTFPRRRGRNSGRRSVVSCPTALDSADPKGQFLHPAQLSDDANFSD